MALENTNIPPASGDLVAVFDGNNNQVFSGASPMRNNTTPRARIMDHPLEDGSVISDHIVFSPVEIQLDVIPRQGEARSIYQQINQLFLAGALLTVQGKTITYSNMVISEAPFLEEPDIFDTITVGIKLRRATFVTPEFGALPASAVRDPVQQDTVKTGAKQPSQPYSVPPEFVSPSLKGTSALPDLDTTRTVTSTQGGTPPPPSKMQWDAIRGAAE